MHLFQVCINDHLMSHPFLIFHWLPDGEHSTEVINFDVMLVTGIDELELLTAGLQIDPLAKFSYHSLCAERHLLLNIARISALIFPLSSYSRPSTRGTQFKQSSILNDHSASYIQFLGFSEKKCLCPISPPPHQCYSPECQKEQDNCGVYLAPALPPGFTTPVKAILTSHNLPSTPNSQLSSSPSLSLFLFPFSAPEIHPLVPLCINSEESDSRMKSLTDGIMAKWEQFSDEHKPCFVYVFNSWNEL